MRHTTKILLFQSLLSGLLGGFCGQVLAQNSVLISQNDINGIDKITNNVYSSDGLWGYINGGADLYLEYGFDVLTSQRITIEATVFSADIYRMVSPEAAYGVFCVQRYKCLKSNLLSDFDCLTAHQYLAAKNHYLISVVSPNSSEENRQRAVQIAGLLINKIEEPSTFIPIEFQSVELKKYIQNLKFVKGRLGLQNAYPSWERFFEGIESFNAWILPVENEQGKSVLARVRFNDVADNHRFISQNNLTSVENEAPATNAENRLFIIRKDNNLIWLIQGHVDAQIRQLIPD